MYWQAITTCRVCLKDQLENFFEFAASCYFAPDNLTFRDVFSFCTQLLITPEDGLPQRICSGCAKDLQGVYNFLQRVLKNDKELKLIYSGGNENKNAFTKDPLENITDAEEVAEADVNNDEEESCNEFLTNDYNVDNGFVDFAKGLPLTSSPSDDDSKDDNDFLESVETQIFPQGRFMCKLCNKPYFTNSGLQAHMEIHMPKRKKHIAKETSTKTTTRSKNTKHISKESGNESEEYEVLSSKSPQDVMLPEKNEDNVPRSKKTFPCQVCGKQMISASKLRYHMVMHTGEKDFLCSMCPKAYSTIYALKHHMRAHTGERPYECKFCGDRFLRPTTLKSHMRRHTGERPYGCDICGKRFIQHSSMATHMKLNHMDKTIACAYCDKKYARQTDLNTHLLSHSGDKPFACKICPSRFTRQSNLNKHMNQQHPNGNSGDNECGLAAERREEFQQTMLNYDCSLSTPTSNSEMSPCLCKRSTSLENGSNCSSSSCRKSSLMPPVPNFMSTAYPGEEEIISPHHTDFEKLVSSNNWEWPNQT